MTLWNLSQRDLENKFKLMEHSHGYDKKFEVLDLAEGY